MPVVNIESSEQYEQIIGSNKVTAALFSAEWAEQCKQIQDVMTELVGKKEFENLQFINIAAEDHSEISIKHQIDAVPTVIFFQKGSAVDRIDGVNIAAFTTKCKNLAGVTESNIGKVSLEDRLKSLINKSKVMIFMKGDRDGPRCGFSKTLINIMNEIGITYETFDILTDEDVRQGLKTYSDWPTYPQVYVNGELVGGLDIIKELQSSGELLSTLNG